MREPPRRSAHGAIACAVFLTVLVPALAAAQGGGRLENCRFGESCWGGTMDKSNERIQQQMRDARSGNPRTATVEAPAATRPLETAEMDMRLFSFGDCEKRFGNGSAKYQECTRVVASDEARQAKLDRACHESFPTNDAEYERCRAPKRLASDGGVPVSQAGAASNASPSIVMTMPVAPQSSGTPSTAPAAAPTPVPASTAGTAARAAAAASSIGALTPVAQLPEPPEPKPTVTWLGILLCVLGVGAGFVGVRKTYPWLGPPEMLVAATISTLSAVAIYMLFSGVTPKSAFLPHDTFVFVTFNLSWTATIWLLLRKAQTVRRILGRGLLVGAAEWALLVVVAAMFAEAPPILATKAQVAMPSIWSLPLGAGVFPFLNVTVGLAMGAICATAFGFVRFMTRERESPITLRRPAGGYGDFEMTMRGLERRA